MPEDSSVGDGSFASNAIQNMFDLFWMPEVERRGGPDVVGDIDAAMVVFPPNSSPVVMLNEECQFRAVAKEGALIESGTVVTLDNASDVESLEPVGVDPNAGWATFGCLPGGRSVLAFDFRRNRATAGDVLELATEYLATGRVALESSYVGPCLDAIHTAAELAVTALMYLVHDNPLSKRRDRHGQRLHWLNGHTRLNNAPRDFHLCLVRLSELRPSARYANPPLTVAYAEARGLLETVERLIEHARAAVGTSSPADS